MHFMLTIIIYLYASVYSAQPKMILSTTDCFKTLPVPITWPEEASVSPSSSIEQTTPCRPGSLLCPVEDIFIDEPESTTTRPPMVPKDTVFYVADDMNLCTFWRCITPVWAVQMKCAPGSQLEPAYIGGSANPCSVRYYNDPTVINPCARPPKLPTTTAPLSLPGGIPFPAEALLTATRSLPITNIPAETVNGTAAVTEPSTI
ncbi:uncharacterized protein [Watersipora subatra]|uniref:uncharacterized protein n=1 Tax=Watersipora subatra TaxID=2589382 RepID=UPI00355C67AF